MDPWIDRPASGEVEREVVPGRVDRKSGGWRTEQVSGGRFAVLATETVESEEQLQVQENLFDMMNRDVQDIGRQAAGRQAAGRQAGKQAIKQKVDAADLRCELVLAKAAKREQEHDQKQQRQQQEKEQVRAKLHAAAQRREEVEARALDRASNGARQGYAGMQERSQQQQQQQHAHWQQQQQEQQQEHQHQQQPDGWERDRAYWGIEDTESDEYDY